MRFLVGRSVVPVWARSPWAAVFRPPRPAGVQVEAAADGSDAWGFWRGSSLCGCWDLALLIGGGNLLIGGGNQRELQNAVGEWMA
jgi:hypothetical protein